MLLCRLFWFGTSPSQQYNVSDPGSFLAKIILAKLRVDALMKLPLLGQTKWLGFLLDFVCFLLCRFRILNRDLLGTTETALAWTCAFPRLGGHYSGAGETVLRRDL